MTPNASRAARRKSALLWGAVGALFFLVLHQWYLLLDGRFLGVRPIAAVAAAVFAVTAVASYYTAVRTGAPGPDDVSRAGESGAEASETGASGTGGPGPVESDRGAEADSEVEADDAEDEWIWGGQTADGRSDGASEPQAGSE